MAPQLGAQVLFVTALTEERDALLALLENPRLSDGEQQNSNTYHEAALSNERWSSGRISVAVLCLAGMGRVKAAVQTTNAINDLQPEIVLLVGIAGGVRKTVSDLGDVIVGEQIVDYEQQKIDDGADPIRFDVYRGDRSLLKVAQEVADQWTPAMELERAVNVKIGPIASGDKVVASAPHMERLLKQWPKLLGVEMEAGGVAAAAWFATSRPRFLMIRGVSDFADQEKNTQAVDRVRPLACASAALFAVDLARCLPDLAVKIPQVKESDVDEEKRRLLVDLDRLKQELLLAKVSGQDTTEIAKKILDARRALRTGPTLVAGDHLGSGRYELLEKLGAGGFATVWKCADRRTFDVVAIKILHGQWAENATRIQRFERGASQMQRLAHPQIVRVLEDAREEDGFRFFVMELLDGGNLEDVVLNRELGDDEVKEIVLDVGTALSYAHSKGAIHRDVKPQNVLLSAKGEAKLTDFDLVRSLDTTGGTREGALGTLVYSAPECLSDASLADARSDVYSLAMVLLFALRREKLGIEALRDTPALIEACAVSDTIKDAMRKATEWDLSARTTSVAQLCEEIRRGAVDYAGGDRDLPDWLQRRGFTDSCRALYLASYSKLRARRDWPDIEEAVSGCAGRILAELARCFVAGKLPFGDARPAVAAFSAAPLEDHARGFPHPIEKSEERAIKWLIIRRVILGVAKQFRTALAGQRERVEALLIAFLNIAEPNCRGEDFLSGGAFKQYVTTFRPIMTHHGLVPSSLAKGPEHLPSLGEYERKWLLESVPDLWPHKLPGWWP